MTTSTARTARPASAAIILIALLTPATAEDKVTVGGLPTHKYQTSPVYIDHSEVYIDLSSTEGGLFHLSDSIIVSVKKDSPLAKRLLELGKEAIK